MTPAAVTLWQLMDTTDKLALLAWAYVCAVALALHMWTWWPDE